MLNLFRKIRREPAHLSLGRWGEEMAGRMIKKKGYHILGRRVRAGKRGELDLVVRKKDLLVFVEVKTRRNESVGRPANAVQREKQRHVARAALKYISKIREKPEHIRFDIVEVIGTPEMSEPPVIRHLEGAFGLPDGMRYRR